jgi:molybdenum cofactor synthesis domain-containing protein
MAMQPLVTACVVVIGNEILSGRTRDANLAWLAHELNECGVTLREARVIPDVEDVIVRTLNEVRAAFDYIFTTGGIGPTHDDITAASVAKAFGVALEQNPEAVARLRTHYANPADLNAARLRMANIPAGGRLIDNPISKAPGFMIGNVYVMAGVPAIMQAMFAAFRHELSGGRKLISRTLTAALAEGHLAEGLTRIQAEHADLDIGSYPAFRLGHPQVAIVVRGPSAERVEAAAQAVAQLMRALGGEPQWS